ncbi:hypothetical protein GWK47_053337 [Chionoecetes opilio]|uniref:Uncharacterized protein n=1 Tax=Chionoecetes opilio TaxID=41210 RepID=A0A8J4XZ91_CHIOP|nr:hypothetical protein GWK47_053337 [Chionoecetes opilio]
MFHILETLLTKVRWCWLARERGTSTAPPLVSTVLMLRVATLGGCRNPAMCGTPCTCALWKTYSPRRSCGVPACQGDSPARFRLGDLQHPPIAGLDAGYSPVLLLCEAAHDIQERAAYSK